MARSIAALACAGILAFGCAVPLNESGEEDVDTVAEALKKGHAHAGKHGHKLGHRHGFGHHHGHWFKHWFKHHRPKKKHHADFDPCAGEQDASRILPSAACSTGRWVGAAVAFAPLTGEPPYAELLAREFNYVTPENATKWGSLQSDDPEVWDFTQADAIIDAAVAAGQQIKGHTLIWHSQLPAYVNDSLTDAELVRAMRRHIATTVKRYKKVIDGWDVVNESFNGDGSYRDTVFHRKLGEDYIPRAFRMARQADRNAELYYNDFGIETINAKSDAVYALVSDLVARRVPIDGVGFQMHLDARFPPTTEQFVENFARFAELGLSINISELDVRIAQVSASPAEKLALQQQIYHRVASACVMTPTCSAVTTWGFTDRHSWIDSTFGPDDPLPFDDDYVAKPAYYGMVDGMLGLAPDPAGTAPNLVASGSFEVDARGWFGFGIAGTSVTDAAAHTGSKSGIGAGRTATWQGPAVNLNQLVQPAFEYDASAFARIAGASSDVLRMTLKTRCAGESDSFMGLASAQGSDSGWVELTGTFTVPDCTLEEVTLYFEGPAAAVDILVDDVAVRTRGEPLGPNVVSNGDFETGVGGWFGFGSVTVQHSTTEANTGTGSAFVTGRTATFNGPGHNLLPEVILGATYRFSGFVKIAGAASATAQLTVKSRCDGVDSFRQIGQVTANELGWTEISGSYLVEPCALSELTLFAEGPPAGVDIFLDDVSVRQRLSVPVQEPPEAYNVLGNGGVELGTSGWTSFGGGAFAQTTDFVRSGSFAGVGMNRTASFQGPSALLPTGEASYALSIHALQNSAETVNLVLTGRRTCDGASTFHFIGSTSAAPATWVNITGNLSVPAGCTLVQIYVEQNGGSTFPNIYVDDLVATPTSVVNLAGNPGLELGVAGGWQGFGVTFVQTAAQVHSGSFAGVATGRTASFQGGSYFLPTGVGDYSISIFARQDGGSALTLLLSAKTVCNGVESFLTLASLSAPSGTWVELQGSIGVPPGCTSVQTYVQQNGGSAFPDIYLDDITILPLQ
ncbi:MAG TPA: endo-1,4-beta-xylanase [Polyangiaceae bacterium]